MASWPPKIPEDPGWGSAPDDSLKDTLDEFPIVGKEYVRCVECNVEMCEELDASYSVDPLDGLLCTRCRNGRK